MLNAELDRTGLTDAAGHPLIFTPHDFRRMFITDAIMTGLPPHIAQVIAGHSNINVTMGYKATCPEEVITHHQAADGHSPPPASTSTHASDVPCSGQNRPSGPASPRSATTSPPASPRPSAKAGSTRSKDSK
jgi:hypothetical protein